MRPKEVEFKEFQRLKKNKENELLPYNSLAEDYPEGTKAIFINSIDPHNKFAEIYKVVRNKKNKWCGWDGLPEAWSVRYGRLLILKPEPEKFTLWCW
jgi:hypothetical protein